MKTVVLGDTHGRQFWKLVVNSLETDLDRLIFIGDYFDSFDINGKDQINNFLDIIEYKKTGGKEVILLIGNHDHHYFYGVGNTGTSGYQAVMAPVIGHVLEENKEHLQMAYQFEDFLFTHAGVGETFMNDIYGKDGWSVDNLANDLNELWKHKPHAFTFNGWNASGDDMGQTPIWIRPLSLTKDSHNIRKYLKQVVGHTGQREILLDEKSTLKYKYYFIDTLGSAKGQYLIIEDKTLKIGQIHGKREEDT
jgi:predicted phosphodiesterase